MSRYRWCQTERSSATVSVVLGIAPREDDNKVPTHLSFAARAPQEDPNIKHGVYFSPPDVAAEQPKAALNEALQIELFESFEANEEAVG
ncbi:hypothetical protein WG66_010860 [Moniliophthora roreri]|nr:hypothetical protein WG66_010860 [Moniliophthora roreri]